MLSRVLILANLIGLNNKISTCFDCFCQIEVVIGYGKTILDIYNLRSLIILAYWLFFVRALNNLRN